MSHESSFDAINFRPFIDRDCPGHDGPLGRTWCVNGNHARHYRDDGTTCGLCSTERLQPHDPNANHSDPHPRKP